jgi:hypothetical protein
MDQQLMYRYLQLQSFSRSELHDKFDEIRQARRDWYWTVWCHTAKEPPQRIDDDNDDESGENGMISNDMDAYVLKRITQLDKSFDPSQPLDMEQREEMEKYAQQEATLILNHFRPLFASPSSHNDPQHQAHGATTNNNTIDNNEPNSMTSLSKEDFTNRLIEMASAIDTKRTLPISLSMLLVGSSVGIVTPVMPFVVEQMGLTAGEYGMVVSAFAVAKVAGNVPSAILVERHGRKPYLVHSLGLLAIGVGGIGLATQLEHLVACRLLTGFGVAALSTAATMTIADISTPLNRASTMAPIMSGFAAGTALGPAIGGILADKLGISPTFYLVGVSYLGLTAVNRVLLTETKLGPMSFPWHERIKKPESSSATTGNKPAEVVASVSIAVKGRHSCRIRG